MEWRPLLASSAVACLFVIANILTERSLSAGKGWLMFFVFVAACAAFIGFRWCCRHYGLAIASSVVDSFLTLGTVGYAFVVLGESLSRSQCCGIAFLLAGLLLVNWPYANQQENVLGEGGVGRCVKSHIAAKPQVSCSVVGEDGRCRCR